MASKLLHHRVYTLASEEAYPRRVAMWAKINVAQVISAAPSNFSAAGVWKQNATPTAVQITPATAARVRKSCGHGPTITLVGNSPRAPIIKKSLRTTVSPVSKEGKFGLPSRPVRDRSLTYAN